MQDLEKTRELLSKEQGRSMKLEAALAEARQKLTTVSELERELGNYRCAWQCPVSQSLLVFHSQEVITQSEKSDRHLHVETLRL